VYHAVELKSDALGDVERVSPSLSGHGLRDLRVARATRCGQGVMSLKHLMPKVLCEWIDEHGITRRGLFDENDLLLVKADGTLSGLPELSETEQAALETMSTPPPRKDQ
jgi:hypothetical protein